MSDQETQNRFDNIVAGVEPIKDENGKPTDYQINTSTGENSQHSESTSTSQSVFGKEDYEKYKDVTDGLKNGTYYADIFNETYGKQPNPEEAEKAKKLAEKRTKLARIGEALRLVVDMGTAIGGGNVYSRESIEPTIDKIKKQAKDEQDKYDKALKEYQEGLHKAKLLDAQHYINKKDKIEDIFLNNAFKKVAENESDSYSNSANKTPTLTTEAQLENDKKRAQIHANIQKDISRYNFHLQQNGDSGVVLYAKKDKGGLQQINVPQKQWEGMKKQIAGKIQNNPELFSAIAAQYENVYGAGSAEIVAQILNNPQSNPSLYENILAFSWCKVPDVAKTVKLPKGLGWKTVTVKPATTPPAGENSLSRGDIR